MCTSRSIRYRGGSTWNSPFLRRRILLHRRSLTSPIRLLLLPVERAAPEFSLGFPWTMRLISKFIFGAGIPGILRWMPLSIPPMRSASFRFIFSCHSSDLRFRDYWLLVLMTYTFVVSCASRIWIKNIAVLVCMNRQDLNLPRNAQLWYGWAHSCPFLFF